MKQVMTKEEVMQWCFLFCVVYLLLKESCRVLPAVPKRDVIVQQVRVPEGQVQRKRCKRISNHEAIIPHILEAKFVFTSPIIPLLFRKWVWNLFQRRTHLLGLVIPNSPTEGKLLQLHIPGTSWWWGCACIPNRLTCTHAHSQYIYIHIYVCGWPHGSTQTRWG